MKTFIVKMSFICMIIKNNFHKKGFAIGLVLKQRLAASRKWPNVYGLRTIIRIFPSSLAPLRQRHKFLELAPLTILSEKMA